MNTSKEMGQAKDTITHVTFNAKQNCDGTAECAQRLQ